MGDGPLLKVRPPFQSKTETQTHRTPLPPTHSLEQIGEPLNSCNTVVL